MGNWRVLCERGDKVEGAGFLTPGRVCCLRNERDVNFYQGPGGMCVLRGVYEFLPREAPGVDCAVGGVETAGLTREARGNL